MDQPNKDKNVKIEKKKVIRPVVKYSLKAAVELKWPKVDGETNQNILNALLSDFKALLPIKLSGGRTTSSLNIKLNQHCIIGVNAVTRALEKQPLSFVVVCASGSNAGLSAHLIPLCVKQKTPACSIKGLSASISPLFKMRSVLAIGFKDCKDNIFHDLVEILVDKAIDLTLPWGQNVKQTNEENILESTVEVNAVKRQVTECSPTTSPAMETPRADSNGSHRPPKRLIDLNVHRNVFIPKSKKCKGKN